MIFTIRRAYEEKGTPGKLYYDNQLVCHTIERPKDGDHPCTQEGTFTASRYNSPKHGPNTWQLDVPGRSNIQFHICKGPDGLLDYVVPRFLLGCISPGMKKIELRGEPGVGGSIEAYGLFMKLTEAENHITFVIEEDK